MKGQLVADFIVEHQINDIHKLDMSYLTITPWTLYFDGSVCNEGQCWGLVLKYYELRTRQHRKC
jgi:hypothetical protein